MKQSFSLAETFTVDDGFGTGSTLSSINVGDRETVEKRDVAYCVSCCRSRSRQSAKKLIGHHSYQGVVEKEFGFLVAHRLMSARVSGRWSAHSTLLGQLVDANSNYL